MPAVEIEKRKVLSANHVSELIGYAPRTIRRWGHTGEHGFPPPFVNVGRPRWHRRDIERWLDERAGR